MTDSIELYRNVISSTKTLIDALDRVELLADRFQADFGLFATCAAAANQGGRADLVAQDFDNFVGAVVALKNANTGTVKAYLYKML